MQKFVKLVAVFVGILVVWFSFSSSSKSGNDQRSILKNRAKGQSQIVQSISLNKNYDFAGEAFPMDNFDVRERIERELYVNKYYHSSTIVTMKLSGRLFPVIEKILKEEGVPEDFKYLAVAESNLRNATSPAGAKGVWQLMPQIATHYGLTVNKEVDERFNLEKSTLAACTMLKELKKKFGSWTLAAAAYNMGSTGLNRDIDLQKTSNYFDMNLNEETGRYLFRIVAIKELYDNPEKFGYYIPTSEYYEALDDYQVVIVKGKIENIGDFAKKFNTTYRMVKVYNPWLLTHKLTNSSKKEYIVKVPK